VKKISIFLICLAITLIATIIAVGFFRENSDLVSPASLSSNVLGLNQWFPVFEEDQYINSPKITAKSALFVDSTSGQVLFDKNSKDKLPIASLTKVMTVLIALEHKDLNDQMLVSDKASNMEPDKMLLIAEEKLTLKELLYGIFLISANDGAEVLAERSTGSREEFLRLMNDKARQLGMEDSLFVNPTGLDEDMGSSYSSAYDLVLLTRYLIKHFPQVVDISKTEHIVLPETVDHQAYDMYSGINLLTTYPGVVGFKTGFTPEAGFTLITLARENGHEVIGVMLGSENRREEAKELLDYSFTKL